MSVQPGTVVGGDFRLGEPVAEVSLGVLYLAEEVSTGKPRTLELLTPGLLDDPALREGFESYAKVGAKLASDHFVEVVAAGIDEALGRPWLALELLQGESLAGMLARRGPIAPHEARVVFAQIGHALSAAHAAGVVHRALTPESVFVARLRGLAGDFKIKLLDLGLAQLLEEARPEGGSGAAFTPRYLAPEQTGGQLITPRTDVWALGLLAFEALAGKPYWRRALGPKPSSDELIREVLFEPLVAPSRRAGELGLSASFPTGFDAWFARCVAREPSERFPDAATAITALDPLLAAVPAPASAFSAYAIPGRGEVTHVAAAPGAPEPTLVSAGGAAQPIGEAPAPALVEPPKPRRRGLLVAGGAAGLLALIGLGVGGVYAYGALAKPKKKSKKKKKVEDDEDDGELPEDLTGSYEITKGSYPSDTGTYQGKLTVSGGARVPEVYRVGWSNGTEGIGLRARSVLGVAWGVEPYGLAIYAIDGGTLKGRVVMTTAAAVEPQVLSGPAGLSGSYEVRGAPGMSVTITPTGETYALTYATGAGSFAGTGIVSGKELVVALAVPGAGGGVGVYTRKGKSYEGRWALLNATALGREKLKKTK